MAAFGIACSSCDAACAHVSSPTCGLCASLPVLALGRFDGVAEDDRREQGDGPHGESGDDQRHQCRRVAGREAHEEGDDGYGVAAVADALAEAAGPVDAGPPGTDGIVSHASGSQPRSSSRWRSWRRSRATEKWRRATAWLSLSTSTSGWSSHAANGPGSEAGNHWNPKARSSSATG